MCGAVPSTRPLERVDGAAEGWQWQHRRGGRQLGRVRGLINKVAPLGLRLWLVCALGHKGRKLGACVDLPLRGSRAGAPTRNVEALMGCCFFERDG